MRTSDFFRTLRKPQQPEGRYQAFAYIDQNKKFHETFDVADFYEPGPQPKGCDWYFTPLIFTVPARANETATGLNWLFADLDAASYKDSPIEPTFVWETSPGRQQALWGLKDPIPTYKVWAELNRRLTHATGADPGGWPGAKLLRVPGSLHYKQGEPVLGKWLVEKGPYHHVVKVASTLNAIPIKGQVISEGEHPAQMDRGEYAEWLVRNAHLIPLSVKHYIGKAAVKDRSLHIIKVAGICKGMGLSKEDTFHILSGVQWNKWRHKPEMLWQQLSGVFAD